MNNWYDNHISNFAFTLSEDVYAPELRNPNNSAIRFTGWLARIFKGRRR